MELRFPPENEEIILRWMSVILIGVSALVFLLMQVLSAPYGRYTSRSWGFSVECRLAWFLQELPSVLLPLLVVFLMDNKQLYNNVNKTLLAMFSLHYAQRSLVYPFLIHGGKPTPVIPFFLALIFCSYNGYMQGRYIANYADYPASWLSDPSFLLGLGLFFLGMLINIHSDHILRSLRKPGEMGYKIPRGGMFEFVSGANFLGEIIEWWGFALASWNLPAVAFAIFVSSNIGPRAFHHHRWYLEKFRGDYPRHRRILIPFIL